MSTTLRGRDSTGMVVLAAILSVLAAIFVSYAIGAPPAHAETPPTTGPVSRTVDGGQVASGGSRLSVVAALASSLAVEVGEASMAVPVVVPQPPEPPAYCPAPGSQFVDSWGFARSGGRRHQGVDMMAPHGTPVYAPVTGTIRDSHSALGGLAFYLTDAAGNEYFGGHLDTLDVIGPVEAGQQIGTVGSTGNASSPHLHFEVHPGAGAAVNPYPFVLNWCTADFGDPATEALLP